VIEDCRPWAVVNCCGFPSILPAEEQPDRCYADNVLAAGVLAEITAAMGIGYAVLSTDRVFDGERTGAYVASDRVRPLGLFGETKHRGEREVERRHEAPLILRTGPLFGAGAPDMLARSLREARRAARVDSERDLLVSPTYIPDLVHAMLDLLIDRAHGLWHLINAGEIDGLDLLQRAGLPAATRMAMRGEGALTRGRRPVVPSGVRNLVMTSERALLLPPLSSALDRFGGSRMRSAAE
jgi:dTDP-4-dehydrorhamnose reductase